MDFLMLLAPGFRGFRFFIVGSVGLRGVREMPTDSFTDHTEFQSVRARRNFRDHSVQRLHALGTELGSETCSDFVQVPQLVVSGGARPRTQGDRPLHHCSVSLLVYLAHVRERCLTCQAPQPKQITGFLFLLAA